MIFETIKRKIGSDSTSDELLYLRVMRELEAGYKRDGLWVKALAETDGDTDKAHAKYIRLRVLSIKEEIATTQKTKHVSKVSLTANPSSEATLKVREQKPASITLTFFLIFAVATGIFAALAIGGLAVYAMYISFNTEDEYLKHIRLGRIKETLLELPFVVLSVIVFAALPWFLRSAFKRMREFKK